MFTLTLSVDALVQIREALKLTPQSDTDTGWDEAWREVTKALALSVDLSVDQAGIDHPARRGERR